MCARCRLAAHCTRSKAGRSLNRYPGHHLLERARRQSHGPAAQRDRQRRQWLQERNFAEATTQHGFKRARWRGLAKQTIQDQLIATLQNLKILLRKGRLGYFALLWVPPTVAQATDRLSKQLPAVPISSFRLTMGARLISSSPQQSPLGQQPGAN